jgi:dynein heavy chain
MYWTRDTGEAVARGTLGEYSEQCTEELMKVVNKVREREV